MKECKYHYCKNCEHGKGVCNADGNCYKGDLFEPNEAMREQTKSNENGYKINELAENIEKLRSVG